VLNNCALAVLFSVTTPRTAGRRYFDRAVVWYKRQHHFVDARESLGTFYLYGNALDYCYTTTFVRGSPSLYRISEAVTAVLLCGLRQPPKAKEDSVGKGMTFFHTLSMKPTKLLLVAV